jgi:hypothetical protein
MSYSLKMSGFMAYPSKDAPSGNREVKEGGVEK